MKKFRNFKINLAGLTLVLLCTLAMVVPSAYGVSGTVKLEELTKRPDVIWGFDFLPDGRVLMSERSGQLILFDPKTKKTESIKGVPKVHAEGQGGLLDIRVHPDYEKNKWIYFTYAEPKDKGGTTALARAKLEGSQLKPVEKLFSGNGATDEDQHYGSRIAFDGKGHVFFAIGDRGTRDQVQDLSYHTGKMIRLKEDGSVPKDNPFVAQPNAKPEIWSLGLRSPQGLVIHPETKELWEAEMGPRGGDEINLIKKGANYGWPLVTKGREYSGLPLGEKSKTGMEEPIAHWVPSISPSGISFYFGNKYPGWNGDLFIANLSGMHIRRLDLEKGKVIHQQELLKDVGVRFRQIRQGPDGFLYVSTDDGKLARIVKLD